MSTTYAPTVLAHGYLPALVARKIPKSLYLDSRDVTPRVLLSFLVWHPSVRLPFCIEVWSQGTYAHYIRAVQVKFKLHSIWRVLQFPLYQSYHAVASGHATRTRLTNGRRSNSILHDCGFGLNRPRQMIWSYSSGCWPHPPQLARDYINIINIWILLGPLIIYHTRQLLY